MILSFEIFSNQAEFVGCQFLTKCGNAVNIIVSMWTHRIENFQPTNLGARRGLDERSEASLIIKAEGEQTNERTKEQT